jgi:hypothetical protein
VDEWVSRREGGRVDGRRKVRMGRRVDGRRKVRMGGRVDGRKVRMGQIALCVMD